MNRHAARLFGLRPGFPLFGEVSVEHTLDFRNIFEAQVYLFGWCFVRLGSVRQRLARSIKEIVLISLDFLMIEYFNGRQVVRMDNDAFRDCRFFAGIIGNIDSGAQPLAWFWRLISL